jgi:hypothetical protein
MPLLRNVKIIVAGIELGWFEIKTNVYVELSTRGDQRNLGNLGAPLDRGHWVGGPK